MKHILCFGDSLTWGMNPETYERFAYDQRWTGILQKTLGEDYRIIEEGLNGRTTVYDDLFTPYGNYGVGADLLPMILDTHAPLDLVILMLGSNDIQPHRFANAKTAARGCGQCIDQIMKSIAGSGGQAPKILLVAPPAFKRPRKFMEVVFDENIKESRHFAKYFEMTADFYGVAFLDAGQYIQSSDIDGVHFDLEANKVLAEQLAKKVSLIL